MLRRASHDLKTPEPDAGDIQTLLNMIEGSKMPLVLVGGGVIRSKGAVPEFRKFVETLGAPVASTACCLGAQPAAPRARSPARATAQPKAPLFVPLLMITPFPAAAPTLRTAAAVVVVLAGEALSDGRQHLAVEPVAAKFNGLAEIGYGLLGEGLAAEGHHLHGTAAAKTAKP